MVKEFRKKCFYLWDIAMVSHNNALNLEWTPKLQAKWSRVYSDQYDSKQTRT